MSGGADELKGFLRDLGQPVQDSGDVSELPPPPASGGGKVIVLERVRQDATPEYCIHGYSECIRCYQPVWLGHETIKQVQAGAYPICLECATIDIPEHAVERIGRVEDHLRKDGPHE